MRRRPGGWNSWKALRPSNRLPSSGPSAGNSCRFPRRLPPISAPRPSPAASLSPPPRRGTLTRPTGSTAPPPAGPVPAGPLLLGCPGPDADPLDLLVTRPVKYPPDECLRQSFGRPVRPDVGGAGIQTLDALARESEETVYRLCHTKEGPEDESYGEKVNQYIGQHFSDPELTVTQIADHFGVSSSYLLRVYKKDCGAAASPTAFTAAGSTRPKSCCGRPATPFRISLSGWDMGTLWR